MIRKFRGENDWLSNFAPVNITLNGVTYASVEHAYMSAKSENPEWKKLCADSTQTAGTIKRLSKFIALVDGWEQRKVTVMRSCLVQKYHTEPYRTKLINTGTEYIQEGNDWGDVFWGVNLETGEGENNLGKLIMYIRLMLTEKFNFNEARQLASNYAMTCANGYEGSFDEWYIQLSPIWKETAHAGLKKELSGKLKWN